jgi:hypothetical protein
MGDREAAIKHLRASLEIDPSHEQARGMLNELLALEPVNANLGQP